MRTLLVRRPLGQPRRALLGRERLFAPQLPELRPHALPVVRGDRCRAALLDRPHGDLDVRLRHPGHPEEGPRPEFGEDSLAFSESPHEAGHGLGLVLDGEASRRLGAQRFPRRLRTLRAHAQELRLDRGDIPIHRALLGLALEQDHGLGHEAVGLLLHEGTLDAAVPLNQGGQGRRIARMLEPRDPERRDALGFLVEPGAFLPGLDDVLRPLLDLVGDLREIVLLGIGRAVEGPVGRRLGPEPADRVAGFEELLRPLGVLLELQEPLPLLLPALEFLIGDGGDPLHRLLPLRRAEKRREILRPAERLRHRARGGRPEDILPARHAGDGGPSRQHISADPKPGRLASKPLVKGPRHARQGWHLRRAHARLAREEAGHK